MLPVETFLEVIKFIPYNNLHCQIRYVNCFFSKLVPLVIDRLYPREYKYIWIRYNRKEKRYYLTAFSTNDPPGENRHDLPISPPPPSITRIERIIINGPVRKELLRFFTAIKQKIVNCKLDFDDLGKFMSSLRTGRIPLKTIFRTFPSSCLRISLDGRLASIPSSFLLSDYVLQCSNLYVMRPCCNGIDHRALAKWLLLKEEAGAAKTKFLEMTLDRCYPCAAANGRRQHTSYVQLFEELQNRAITDAHFEATTNFEVQLIGQPQQLQHIERFAVTGKLAITALNEQVVSVLGGKAIGANQRRHCQMRMMQTAYIPEWDDGDDEEFVMEAGGEENGPVPPSSYPAATIIDFKFE